MKIKLLGNNTQIPKKQKLPDVGLDIFLPTDFSIEPFETKVIDLQLAVAIPEGFGGILCPRSSIAAKGLIIQNSFIDPDYTAAIHLIITNCSSNHYDFHEGERLCSLACMNVANVIVEVVDELQSTTRGSQGLGSTGK